MLLAIRSFCGDEERLLLRSEPAPLNDEAALGPESRAAWAGVNRRAGLKS